MGMVRPRLMGNVRLKLRLGVWYKARLNLLLRFRMRLGRGLGVCVTNMKRIQSAAVITPSASVTGSWSV